MESKRIMLYFDENRWHNFGAATYGRTNTEYKGFQKISSKHREEKSFSSKDDSSRRCHRNHTLLMTCKTHSYRKAASSSEILVPTYQIGRPNTLKKHILISVYKRISNLIQGLIS
jgi:hypothetical protein